jgi:hypothetical protein
MSKICFTPKKFSAEKLNMIAGINQIVEEYWSQGYSLTTRQVYYQFVARGLVANRAQSYSLLQGLLNDARLAGLVDWDAIVDRTRGVVRQSHWEHPRDVIESAADSFKMDKWNNQPNYVEVWVEKDAQKGIVAQACEPLDVPYFSCRGYTSVTEIYQAARRFAGRIEHGQTIRVIHLGDHDPSGLDMTRDIQDRLQKVFRVDAKVYRVALNRDQIDRYSPPPNPAKMSDSRATAYVERHGHSSWELDALEPSVTTRIIRANILHWRDEELWNYTLRRENKAKHALKAIHSRWNEVIKTLQRPKSIPAD